MSNLRQRSIFGVLFVLLGALLFLVSSAFVIDRGYPKVLAAIVGGLAFPVLPVVWQIWGERRRAKKQAEAKKPSKSQLTTLDRFWFRFATVALLIVGPMIYLQKFGVVTAAIHHGLWFVPEVKPGLGSIGDGERRNLDRVEPLLQRVPSDAETVIVYTPTSSGEGLIAFNQRDLMAAAEGDISRDSDQVRRINTIFKAQHFVLADSLDTVLDRDLTLAASDRWKTKVEPAPKGLSSSIRRELERAPKAATAFAAYVPVHSTSIRGGATWLLEHGNDYVIEGRIEATDVGHAYALVHQVEELKAGKVPVPLAADCKAAVTALLSKMELVQYMNVITLRAPVTEDFVRDLERCSN